MIIAEVGLNHLGDERLAIKYIDRLSAMEIDGITFQMPKRSFFQDPQNSHLRLKTGFILDAISYAKSLGLKFGLAICDAGAIEKFENRGVDFYKVLSRYINDDVLIKMLVNKTNKKIFVSVGCEDLMEISGLMRKMEQISGRVVLVHTNLGGEVGMECLAKINLLRNRYGVSVGYGTHCKNKNAIYLSLAYEPDSLLFYVKIDDKCTYPDNEHAYVVSEVPSLLENIRELKKTIGMKFT